MCDNIYNSFVTICYQFNIYPTIFSKQTSERNPYQITLTTGEGFHPAQDEQKRMEAIDRRLQSLLPKSDFESIASTPMPRGQSQQVRGDSSGQGRYVSRYSKWP